MNYNYREYISTFPCVVIAVGSNDLVSSACGLYKEIFDDVGRRYEKRGINFAYTDLTLSSRALKEVLRKHSTEMDFFPKTLFIKNKKVLDVATGLLEQGQLEELLQRYFGMCS